MKNTKQIDRKEDERRAIVAVAVFILVLIGGIFYNAIVNGMKL